MGEVAEEPEPIEGDLFYTSEAELQAQLKFMGEAGAKVGKGVRLTYLNHLLNHLGSRYRIELDPEVSPRTVAQWVVNQ